MRRSFWFMAGASAGVYAAARARRAAEILTVDGLRDRVGAAVVGVRMFRDDVAQGKADAEGELRERIAGGIDRRRELVAGTGTALPPTEDHTESHPDHPGTDHLIDDEEEGS